VSCLLSPPCSPSPFLPSISRPPPPASFIPHQFFPLPPSSFPPFFLLICVFPPNPGGALPRAEQRVPHPTSSHFLAFPQKHNVPLAPSPLPPSLFIQSPSDTNICNDPKYSTSAAFHHFLYPPFSSPIRFHFSVYFSSSLFNY
jgi:hypothetical protein